MFLQKVGCVPDKWIYAYAHAVVEGKGLSGDTALHNLKFVWALIGVSAISFFRWKRHLPFRAIKTMTAWAAGSFKNISK